MQKYSRKFTPDFISKLGSDEVFVFGSNLQGHHDGGAAHVALENFGARYGVGEGMQGQSYAIPTMQGGTETIKPYVDSFIGYASNHPDKTFYVTRIGCGIAGFAPEEIAPLFIDALSVQNIILPEDFVEIIDVPQKGNEAKVDTLATGQKIYSEPFEVVAKDIEGETLVWVFNHGTIMSVANDHIKQRFRPALVWQSHFALEIDTEYGAENGVAYTHKTTVLASKEYHDDTSFEVDTILVEYLCKKDEKAAKDKIRAILRVALDNDHDSLVIGTMGWESSGIEPKRMARLFHEVFVETEFKDRFKKICFARDPSCLCDDRQSDIIQAYLNEFPHTEYTVGSDFDDLIFDDELQPGVRLKSYNGKYKIWAIKEFGDMTSCEREYPKYFKTDFDEVIIVGEGLYEVSTLTARRGIGFYLLVAVKNNSGWRLIRIIDQSAAIALESKVYYPTLVELLDANKLTGRIDYLLTDFENNTLQLTTPDSIIYLRNRNVFVFGSSFGGHHNGGAAQFAHEYFGAIEDHGKGLHGQSYAIPTKGQSLDSIRKFVKEFIDFAKSDEGSNLTFWVTPIGCKNAGFTEKQIAPLFEDALKMDNIVLPKSFIDILTTP